MQRARDMVTLTDLQRAGRLSNGRYEQFICQAPVNLYKSPQQESLVTQAAAGRHLRLVEAPTPELGAVEMCLCEDDYPGWVAIADLPHLQPVPEPYAPPQLSAAEIEQKLPGVITFALDAMAQPNEYLWGGTVGPNYDCSGLMQAAFASVGIRLPRDAYQQEAFAQPVALEALRPGDLIFFGSAERTTHVALYLGEGRYIHSSGKDQGRNGIGLDSLSEPEDPIGLAYYNQVKGFGRVVSSYQPQGRPQYRQG
ncbi:MAG TPA: C40 family peptidase [Trichocoleus sp.]